MNSLLLALALIPSIFCHFTKLPIDRRDELVEYFPVKVDLDLDLPPKERFQKAFTQSQIDSFNDIQTQFLLRYPVFIPLFKSLERIFSLSYDEEFNSEVAAWSELIGVRVGRILVWNYLYELLHMCTSIVTQSPIGKIFHGRNLDYPFTDLAAQLFYQGNYYKNGKLLFTADAIVGISVIVTGVRPGAFSFSINDRNFKPVIYQATRIALYSRPPIGWYMRKLIETSESFWEAYQQIHQDEFLARVYITLAGINANEGVIIEKDEYFVDDEIWLMNFFNVNYIQVTNQDRDRFPKYLKDSRRAALLTLIRIQGESPLFSHSSLKENFLMKYPLNHFWNLYSVTMCPADGSFEQSFWFPTSDY